MPNTWSRTPPMLDRCWEGKVENIFAVSGVVRYSPLSCSYLVYTVDNNEYQLYLLTTQEHPSILGTQLQMRQMIQDTGLGGSEEPGTQAYDIHNS